MNWEIENSGLSEWPPKKKHQKRIYYKTYEWSESEFIKMDSTTLFQRGIMDYFNDYIFDENLESFIGSVLSNKDIEYMTSQYKAIKSNAEWDFKNEKIKIRRNSTRLSKKITYFYAVPIYNQDKSIVLLKKMVYCGKLCAEHAVYIFKRRENGDWEMIHFTNYWVS